MTYEEKKSLYESIMKEVAKTLKKRLNELSPEVYYKAADKRQAQVDALPTYLKNKLPKNLRNAPSDLRKHANKLSGYEEKPNPEKVVITVLDDHSMESLKIYFDLEYDTKEEMLSNAYKLDRIVDWPYRNHPRFSFQLDLKQMNVHFWTTELSEYESNLGIDDKDIDYENFFKNDYDLRILADSFTIKLQKYLGGPEHVKNLEIITEE